MIYGHERGLSKIHYWCCSLETLFNKRLSEFMFLQIVNTLGEFRVKSVRLGRAFSSGSSEMRRNSHFLGKKGKGLFYSSFIPLLFRLILFLEFLVTLDCQPFSCLLALSSLCLLNWNNSITWDRSCQLCAPSLWVILKVRRHHHPAAESCLIGEDKTYIHYLSQLVTRC